MKVGLNREPCPASNLELEPRTSNSNLELDYAAPARSTTSSSWTPTMELTPGSSMVTP